ncbi:hypothetical protein [Bradyrhizobium liaoningense]|uniref:hypothetical protein n=1 Tax=Bradyrhizobium liaoningense TaxID=43992 RepID=UPI001FE4B4E9|nr:hypothetical protein [Bradyrhizobium liaoningense]
MRALRPKEEGRIAIVTNAGRVAVDVGHIGAKSFAGREAVSESVAHTTGVIGVRPNRVVLAPGVCAPSLAVMWRPNRARASVIRNGDGGNSATLPGESTTYAVPTTAQGRPDVWLHLYAAVQILVATFRTVDRGCPAGTRSSLRPLSIEGEATKQNSGEISREDEQPCLSLNNNLVPRTLRSTK